MRVLPGPTKSNQVLAWSPDGRFVVAGGTGDGVMAWPADGSAPGRRVLAAGHGGEALRFCPRTGHLYVAFRSNGVWVFDPDTDDERQLWPYDYTTQYSWPAMSDDGRTLVLRRSRYSRPHSTTTYELVGFAIADDGTLAEQWARSCDDDASRIAFRPHTDQLLRTRGNWTYKTAFEWADAATGANAGRIELPPNTRVAVWELSPDGERIAWLSDHHLLVQRLDEPAAHTLPAADGELRRGLAWSPDGRTLAFGSRSVVKLIDADTLTERRALDWGRGSVRAVAFSPDGLRAAVAAEGGKGWVTVFDLE
jgi:WD40 repeat protein